MQDASDKRTAIEIRNILISEKYSLDGIILGQGKYTIIVQALDLETQ